MNAQKLMKRRFNELERILKNEITEEPVYYFPNPGNWGDGLIRHGTIKFFNEIGLEFEEINHDSEIETGCTIIYGGGGGWCNLWNHSEGYVTYLSKLATKILVLPSTYDREFHTPNTLFFSRDLFQSSQNMPNSIFCHDMAFWIQEDFNEKDKIEQEKGFFFRTDRESANRLALPEANQDISLRCSYLDDIRLFFKDLNKYSIIYTDRLHVAIASCLLGKEVHIFEGSYFKNYAVYKSSISDFFSDSFFHHDASDLQEIVLK